MTPLVSVVIPSYNHGRYIAAAVRSVLAQSMGDFELIVIDDGSTDDSLTVLARFDDPRMRVIAQENQGAHAAINAGLGQARGEYLAILNSDDAYHPERLARLVNALRDDQRAGLAASYVEIIDADGFVVGVKHGHRDLSPYALPHPERSFRAGEDLRRALTTENYLATTSNFVFRRDVWRAVGDFRPLRYTHDWDFALRVARRYDLVLLPQPLVQYRVHAANTIRERGVLLAFESCWCQAVHLPMIMREDAAHSPELLSRLLHSLHHHDADGLFAATMFAYLSSCPEAERDMVAVRMLDPHDPLRRICLEYLEQMRLEQPQPQKLSRAQRIRSRVLARARAIMRNLRITR
jgi:glycosyltransferase involved in cell wall biosynthesis